MKIIYRLMLEKWAKDLAISTAAGVTAGMQAALGDAEKPLESRVDAQLADIFDSLNGETRALPANNTPQLPEATEIRRGPGRPPGAKNKPKDGDNGGPTHV